MEIIKYIYYKLVRWFLAALPPIYLYCLAYSACVLLLRIDEYLKLESLKEHIHITLIEWNYLTLADLYMEELPPFFDWQIVNCIALIAVVYPLN